MLLRSVNQKCGSEVSLKSVAQKCQSKVLLRSVAQKCRSELLLGSLGQKFRSEVLLGSVAQKFRSEVCSKSVTQGNSSLLRGIATSLMSLRYVCRNVARVVAQDCRSAVLLMCACVSVCVCRSKVFSECRSGAPLSVAQKCCSEVLLRSIAQKRRSHVCVCVCVFAQKCCSEVLIRSIGQSCY